MVLSLDYKKLISQQTLDSLFQTQICIKFETFHIYFRFLNGLVPLTHTRSALLSHFVLGFAVDTVSQSGHRQLVSSRPSQPPSSVPHAQVSFAMMSTWHGLCIVGSSCCYTSFERKNLYSFFLKTKTSHAGLYSFSVFCWFENERLSIKAREDLRITFCP